MESYFHSLIPFLQSRGGPAENTVSTESVFVAQQCFFFQESAAMAKALSLCFRWNVFTEPLPSNGHLIWLHDCGLQASCHNTFQMTVTSLPISSKVGW
jgi:hypothetical protein